MTLLVLFAFFLGFYFSGFFSHFSYLSVDLHQVCLQAAPKSEYRDLYTALICGKRINHSTYALALQNLGLVHLFVVSGAHLHFIDKMMFPLRVFTKLQWLRLPFLFLFVLTAAFPIPAFRAWLFIAINKLNQRFKLHIPKLDRLLLSVLLCLSFFPQQFVSIGLPLSWLACLGLVIGRNAFQQSACIYFLTLPLILKIQYLSPWSIIINAFMSPWVGSVLFPASLLPFFFPPLASLSDNLWEVFCETSLFLLPHVQTDPIQQQNLPPLAIWVLCFVFHLAAKWLFSKRVQS